MSLKNEGGAQTFTGLAFYPDNPAIFDIRDIAHALSCICRFGGHSKSFYSVAQHSVICAEYVAEKSLQYSALMHDAAEAYIGDMIRSFKQGLKFHGQTISDLEHNILDNISIKLKRDIFYDDPLIKRVDNEVLLAEKRDLMNPLRPYQFVDWSTLEELYVPIEKKIEPMPPEMAEIAFLAKYRELTSA